MWELQRRRPLIHCQFNRKNGEEGVFYFFRAVVACSDSEAGLPRHVRGWQRPLPKELCGLHLRRVAVAASCAHPPSPVLFSPLLYLVTHLILQPSEDMLLFPPSHATHRAHGRYSLGLLGNFTVVCVCAMWVCYTCGIITHMCLTCITHIMHLMHMCVCVYVHVWWVFVLCMCCVPLVWCEHYAYDVCCVCVLSMLCVWYTCGVCYIYVTCILCQFNNSWYMYAHTCTICVMHVMCILMYPYMLNVCCMDDMHVMCVVYVFYMCCVCFMCCVFCVWLINL